MGDLNAMVAHNQSPPAYTVGQESNGQVNPAYMADGPTKEQVAAKEKESQARQVPEDDPWAVAEIGVDPNEKKWADMTSEEKAKRLALNTTKIIVVFGFLYLFICSLDFLSSAFRLIAGKTTGDVMNNDYVQNPIVGLMIGILVTVLVQSSSTSTSIIVSMVSAGILSVHTAVPMILGSNIGTSVTNTIVSLTQVGDRNEFRRAFAGATVHDMFNWLSVIVLLIIEITTGMLEAITTSMVQNIDMTNKGGEINTLKIITEPFTKLVVQLDKNVLKAWSTGMGELANATTLVKQYCKYECAPSSTVAPVTRSSLLATSIKANPKSCVKVGVENSCSFIFYNTSLSDVQIGVILLIASLIILCSALVVIVKILNSMMKGKMANIIRTTLNANVPYMPWITGYIAIFVGAFMTFLVQSSSIFTSTLTPLIGIGVISVERSYPLTLGSNLGTTTTALLASMAGDGDGVTNAIQIALVHLFFNIFGILLFYPIPFMRFPIPLAKKLGDTTAKYRWFAILYLVLMFFVIPGFVFILSLGGPIVLGVIGVPILVALLLAIIINIIQNKKPSILPQKLRNWDWLPKPLHSLEPYDACCLALPCCRSCKVEQDTNELQRIEVVKENAHENQAYEGNADTRI
ncbi:sodium-dependent phosphate transport protein 2B-like [Macrobrachium rosenbergii]|uniref:sodium-dependent phosphate transport protein 2B-like n=1 Tax=Macrobrachium rosenbergii TaxID=79674 RepID=UPI0034D50F6E